MSKCCRGNVLSAQYIRASSDGKYLATLYIHEYSTAGLHTHPAIGTYQGRVGDDILHGQYICGGRVGDDKLPANLYVGAVWGTTWCPVSTSIGVECATSCHRRGHRCPVHPQPDYSLSTVLCPTREATPSNAPLIPCSVSQGVNILLVSRMLSERRLESFRGEEKIGESRWVWVGDLVLRERKKRYTGS